MLAKLRHHFYATSQLYWNFIEQRMCKCVSHKHGKSALGIYENGNLRLEKLEKLEMEIEIELEMEVERKRHQ